MSPSFCTRLNGRKRIQTLLIENPSRRKSKCHTFSLKEKIDTYKDKKYLVSFVLYIFHWMRVAFRIRWCVTLWYTFRRLPTLDGRPSHHKAMTFIPRTFLFRIK